MATGTSLSNYLEEKLANLVLNGVAFTAPTTLKCALYTAAPSDAGGGTEVTGGSYAQQTCTSSFAVWASGSVSNDVAIDFGTATANWGTITHVAIFDGSSNLLLWGALTTPKTIASGDGAKFAVGELTFSLD
jgi:hypothetical protein